MGLISRVSSRTYRNSCLFFLSTVSLSQIMSSKELGQQVDIRSLGPEQIEQLRHQVNSEIQTFSTAIENFKIVQQKYVESRGCIKSLENDTEGKEILIPITSSMYVPGRLKNTNKVIIDIGTGYYVEKNRSDADDFCKRKIEQIAKQLQKVQPALKQRYESKKVIDNTILQLQAQMQQQAKRQK